MAHGHTHMTVGGAYRGRLAIALGISVLVLVAQIVGGLVTGSLALLADAGHVFTDSAGIGLSLLAVTIAARPATPARTFGYQRVEILAAMVNAVLLFAVAAVIVVEAARRWTAPSEVHSGSMLIFACVGLAANAVALVLLRRGGTESLTVRAAYLEVVGDLLGSVAVITAAAVIATTGYERADAIASIAIAALILPRTYTLLRDALHVLLEATPKGVDLDSVRAHMASVPGVIDVHDLHAWTITSGLPVLSAHVVVDEAHRADACGTSVLDTLGDCLAGHFDVEHCTFQIEPAAHVEHEPGAHR